MAQSRPPPSRIHTTPSTTTSSSPPTQAHGEKRHHSRRKSGKSVTESIATSEKKTSSSRPTTLARKQTPQYVTSRQRRDEDEERGRDSGESFPQFCMSCEKQFLPANNTFLYCSESCRIHDHNPPPTPSRISSFPAPTSHSPPLTPYGLHFPTHEDGPDIIPRFSPTQSRPRSYFSSDPYPSSYQAPSVLSASVPHPPPSQYRYPDEKKHTSSKSSSSRKTHGGGSSALESLREIAGALPKVSSSSSSSSSRNERKGSKDSHSSSSSHHDNSSGVWGYIPFTSSSSSSITPGNSYTQVGGYGNVSQSQSYTREDVQEYSYAQNGGGYGGMDRPLPPRSGPGLGYRPKSIDLVTPYGGGH